MRGKIYTKSEKEKVKQLLLAGKTYSQIRAILGVPKSTISTWFGKTLKKPINKKIRREHFDRIQKLASAAIKKKWEQKRKEEIILIKTRMEEELKNYPLNNISVYKSLLAMLYWAEGTKKIGPLTFTNTDPNLSYFYITLLRKCYVLDEKRFRIWLRVHYYHSIKDTKKFWSELLEIPVGQFYKISIKKRGKTKKFRKNFAGICTIRYLDSSIRKELEEIGSILQKIITEDAPVA
ncbi:MAG: hypothetical protein U9Q96_00070 [Patescibacteria group bacterium]|nr:hypothetical protein [Patescibacteria group bacterium]